VRSALELVVPRRHAGQPLLNAIASLRFDEQVVAQSSQWVWRYSRDHFEILHA